MTRAAALAAKFTPGKYRVEGEAVYSDDTTGSVVARFDGRGFEYVHRSAAEVRANAQLFACSPKLFAALAEATDYLDTIFPLDNTNGPLRDAARRYRELLESVVKS